MSVLSPEDNEAKILFALHNEYENKTKKKSKKKYKIIGGVSGAFLVLCILAVVIGRRKDEKQPKIPFTKTPPPPKVVPSGKVLGGPEQKYELFDPAAYPVNKSDPKSSPSAIPPPTDIETPTPGKPTILDFPVFGAKNRLILVAPTEDPLSGIFPTDGITGKNGAVLSLGDADMSIDTSNGVFPHIQNKEKYQEIFRKALQDPKKTIQEDGITATYNPPAVKEKPGDDERFFNLVSANITPNNEDKNIYKHIIHAALPSVIQQSNFRPKVESFINTAVVAAERAGTGSGKERIDFLVLPFSQWDEKTQKLFNPGKLGALFVSHFGKWGNDVDLVISIDKNGKVMDAVERLRSDELELLPNGNQES